MRIVKITSLSWDADIPNCSSYILKTLFFQYAQKFVSNHKETKRDYPMSGLNYNKYTKVNYDKHS